MIPKNITREHVLKAINEIDKEGIPPGRASKKFSILHEGREYPPKLVVSLANVYANGHPLDSSVFNGGEETNSFLKNLEFTIGETKSTSVAYGAAKSSSMSPDSTRVKELFKELMSQPLQKFPRQRERLVAPKEQGVYVIYNSREKVVHVGRTYRGKEGLHQRLYNHLQGLSSFTANYLEGRGEELRDEYFYRHLEVQDPRLRALLEAYATGQLCPTYIGLGDSSK